jgi:hypothetical protein
MRLQTTTTATALSAGAVGRSGGNVLITNQKSALRFVVRILKDSRCNKSGKFLLEQLFHPRHGPREKGIHG